MRHELLTQRVLCIGVNAKKGTLSQHFVTHVPPLAFTHLLAIHIAVEMATVSTCPLSLHVHCIQSATRLLYYHYGMDWLG